MSSIRASRERAGRSKTRRQAPPSGPSPRAVSSIERSITPALPSSSGWAQSTSGQRHSRPWRSSSSDCRNGDPTAIGWTAEQRSCTSPGTVSSPLRVPPPMVSSASSTVTASPSRARATAQASPFGPEPTTIASLKVSGRPPPARWARR